MQHDVIERSWFFEKVTGIRYDHQVLLAMQPFEGGEVAAIARLVRSGARSAVSFAEAACTTLGATALQLWQSVWPMDNLTFATAKQLIAIPGKYWLKRLIRPTGPNTGEFDGQKSTLLARVTSIATYLSPTKVFGSGKTG